MPHAGQTIENPVAGDSVTYLELPGDGAGRLVVEMTTVPGAEGPPPHVHPHSSETFEVLSGSIVVVESGSEHVVGAGERRVVAPGATHTFAGHGVEPARTRVSFDRPGRMGEFLETFYELARAGRLDPAGKPSVLQTAATFLALRDDIRTVLAPWPAQLALFTALAPVARIRGVRPFYTTGELTRADAAAVATAAS